MNDPSRGQLGRDVHRGYQCFDSGNCGSHAARPRRRSSTTSYSARKLNPVERGNTYFAYDLEALAVCEAVKHRIYVLP
jgi:hypothetical protein